MRALAFLLLLPLLGGCISPAGPAVPEADPAARPLRFDCTGASYEPTPGVCAGTLGREGAAWGEPYVAAHPTRQGTFVVAAQGYDATPGAAPVPAFTPGCMDFGVCLHVTEDGGATWTLRDPNVGTSQMVADPLVAFVGDRMLVAALSVAVGGQGLTVRTSEDLGATWGEPVVLTTRAGTDRPWMGVHGEEVMMVWQTSGERQGFWSLSRDAGRTWSEPTELPCNLFSRPHWRDGWLAACYFDGGPRVVRLDATGETLAALPGGSGTLHMSDRDGVLWFAEPGPPRVLRSTDGTSWSEPRSLTEPGMSVAGFSWVAWMEALPWGGAAVLVWGSDADCDLSCGGERATTYLVQTDAAGAVLEAHRLSAGRGAEGDRPARTAQRASGEFDGIACQPGACLVAWMEDGLVDVARVVAG